MRTVYRAESPIDAHLVRGRLEAEGVRAWVLGEHLAGGIGDLPVSGLVMVCVADSDEQVAEAHLEHWAREAREAGRGALAGDDPDRGADPDVELPWGAAPDPA